MGKKQKNGSTQEKGNVNKAIPDYYNSVNYDLLKLIPKNLSIVVEIGCGAGALAKAYRSTNPHTRYLGIELSQVTADYAIKNGRLDKIIVSNVEDVNIEDLEVTEGRVDCIVYGDVLEHLVDPWKVLTMHYRYLNKDGIVLACIPNIAHWSIINNLMCGLWNYQEAGLLEKTHLRFFTLVSIKELFEHTGFRITDVRVRYMPNDNHKKFFRVLAPVLPQLKIDKKMFGITTKAFQYLVIAKKRY